MAAHITTGNDVGFSDITRRQPQARVDGVRAQWTGAWLQRFCRL
ncbi:hypothetical protein ACGFY9_16865 [Streptomyces sp. NPDC048504]